MLWSKQKEKTNKKHNNKNNTMVGQKNAFSKISKKKKKKRKWMGNFGLMASGQKG